MISTNLWGHFGLCVLLALTLIACAPEGAPPLARDASLAVQTEQLSYAVLKDSGAWAVTVPFTFTNREPDSVYVAVACHGEMHAALEKLVNGEWSLAWAGYDHGCPSYLLLAPGESFVSAVHLRTAGPFNELQADTLPGVYRVIVRGVRRQESFQSVWADSTSAEGRRSNVFYLREFTEPWHHRILKRR